MWHHGDTEAQTLSSLHVGSGQRGGNAEGTGAGGTAHLHAHGHSLARRFSWEMTPEEKGVGGFHMEPNMHHETEQRGHPGTSPGLQCPLCCLALLASLSHGQKQSRDQNCAPHPQQSSQGCPGGQEVASPHLTQGLQAAVTELLLPMSNLK